MIILIDAEIHLTIFCNHLRFKEKLRKLEIKGNFLNLMKIICKSLQLISHLVGKSEQNWTKDKNDCSHHLYSLLCLSPIKCNKTRKNKCKLEMK